MQAHLPGGARLDMSSRSALCLGRVAGSVALFCSPRFHVDVSMIYDRNRRMHPGEPLHARAGDLSQAAPRCNGHKEKVRTQFALSESLFWPSLGISQRRREARSWTSIGAELGADRRRRFRA